MKIFSLTLAAIILLGACQEEKYPGYQQTEDGLYYRIFNDSDTGAVPQPGEYLTMDIEYRDMNDSVFMSSYDQQQPLLFPYPGVEHPGDIYSGISKLSVGDSASFILSADSFFTQTVKQPLPAFLDSGDMIKVDIVLRDISSAEEIEALQAEMMREEQEHAMARSTEEKTIIENYMSENNLSGETRPSGLVFVRRKKGSGKEATPGSTVRVNYVGKLMDGTVFDTSIESEAQQAGLQQPGRTYEPLTFPLGQGSVIPGWDEGISLMKEGGKATLIIPSALAYGPQGYGPIPPDAILVFDVELVEVQ